MQFSGADKETAALRNMTCKLEFIRARGYDGFDEYDRLSALTTEQE